MTTVAMTYTPKSVATRARVLKGSIAYLLEELIDTCSEEGIACSGSLRMQLSTQVHELGRYFRTHPHETGSLPEDAEALARIVDQLDGPEVTMWQLRNIQRNFLELLCTVPTR